MAMYMEQVGITTKQTSPVALPAAMWAELEAAYQRPPRAYHNIQHVHEVSAHYFDVGQSPGWQQPKEVYLAVLYHDAIYRAGRKDNELLSAEMALAAINSYLKHETIDSSKTRYLIELTARHGHISVQGLDSDTKHFLDCDMAILGAAPENFLAYDKAIASEYRGKLPGWMFQFYRRKFLKSLLDSSRIYLSERFFQSHEARARANIEALLKKPRTALSASSGR
jgi:predicted metal-dependent HD superfamily phosphohydrolase